MGSAQAQESRFLRILMLPWLAHGHISPFLELAKRFSDRNIHVYFCSTPINLKSIKPKLSERYSDSIQFIELHLPNLPELPPHYHTTNGLPPHLMLTLKAAFDFAAPNFSNILNLLKPDLVIYDFLQHWAPELAAQHNIPAVEYLCTSAAMMAFVYHSNMKPGIRFPFPGIYVHDYEAYKFNNLLECSANGIKDRFRVEKCSERSTEMVLVKTDKDIEGKYIDYMSDLFNKRVVPVGLLVDEDTHMDKDDEKSERIMQWLDKKEEKSTVFVSFGSEYFLSREEIKEIAFGLELSQVNFIWVIRYHHGNRLDTTLHEALQWGFLKRVKARGMVVEDWAPQTKILNHGSIGGFVSHCGWSSVVESMWFGVPIIAMPMHLDQPVNARLVVDIGGGVEVERDKKGRIERERVARSVRDVVVEKVGERVRKRAKELSNNMRRKKGSEIDEALNELLQICRKMNWNKDNSRFLVANS